MVSTSWLDIPEGSHFSLANIPFGIITTAVSPTRHVAIAIGDHVLDLREFADRQGFAKLEGITSNQVETFSHPNLNAFAALGQEIHIKVRKYLREIFEKHSALASLLKDDIEVQRACLFRRDRVQLHLPMKIGGYTDFFAGKNHAYNCGCIFRDPAKALQPNYLHLPVAYNSRASSVVPSGTDIRRPLGQFLDNPSAAASSFGPCRGLDIELELGALLCKGNDMGTPIDVNDAGKHIFGFVLLNDWSARDIQAWEAIPLGPFNSKTFATTISPWVVLKDALEPYRTSGIYNDTKLHPYLQERSEQNVYDISLEVEMRTSAQETAVLSRTNAKNLVFSFAQMIAHHTIGGCPLEVGDLIGSGTISGSEAGTLGSLLELSNGGKRRFELSNAISRTFLEDGDCITIRGRCGNDEANLVGFGECSGTILPAVKLPWLKFEA